MDKIYEQVPPHDLKAESAVIGTFLIDPALIGEMVIKIKPSDFYSKLNALIFDTAVKLYTNNDPVDMINIADKLNTNQLFIDSYKMNYLVGCMNTIQTTVYWESHVQIVRDKATLRQLQSASHKICNKIVTHQDDCKGVVDFAQKQISDVVLGNIDKGGFIAVGDLAEATISSIEKLHNDKTDVGGLHTGFKDLDKKSGGLAKGELIIIAGRPSMGKTTFALNIALNVASMQNKAVAVFSLEMGRNNLMQKFLANLTGINSRNIRKGLIASDKEWQKISQSMKKLSGMNMFIDDCSDVNVLDLRAKSRQLHTVLKNKKIDLELIVVDYMQLMKPIGDEGSREQVVANISRNLKILAKDLDIPIIALSQLSRTTEDRSRKNKRPMLSDLRESGAIEQDADVVMFVYREGYYDYQNTAIQNDATIIIAKNRNDETGDVEMIFEKEISKFSDKLNGYYNYGNQN